MGVRLRSSSGGSVQLDAPSGVTSDVLVEVPAIAGAKLLSDKTPGTVIQVVSHTTTQTLYGTLGGAANPAYNNGTSFTSFAFTPKSANSKLLLMSNNISLSENSNTNDLFYAAAYYDTTRICVSNAPVKYASFGSGYNATWVALHKLFNSWGVTQKTIDIRVGAGNGSGANMSVNYDNEYSSQAGSPEVTFTLMEIAA